MATSNLAPSPPKTTNGFQRTESRPQTRQISSRSHDTAYCNQDRLELPKLSVKNIELQFTSSLRPEFSRISNVQRVRLLTPGHSRSLPGSPNTYRSCRYGNTRGLPLDALLQNTKKNRIPTRIAPLPGQRSVTPELALSQSTLRTGNSLECNGQVVDLDFLQNNSSYVTSLAKLVLSTDAADASSLLQPPSSPDDMTGINDDVTANNDDVMANNESRQEKELTRMRNGDEELLHGTSCEDAEIKSGNEKKEESENMDERENETMNDTSVLHHTQTFSSAEISSFWIPNVKDDKMKYSELDAAAQNVGTEIARELRKNELQEKTNKRETTESTTSVSFYVDLNEVTEHAQCCSCSHHAESRMCAESAQQGRPSKKRFGFQWMARRVTAKQRRQQLLERSVMDTILRLKTAVHEKRGLYPPLHSHRCHAIRSDPEKLNVYMRVNTKIQSFILRVPLSKKLRLIR
ncbi:hypothetical protein QZH41_014723 [Actinostola sp. cb2023]|nr:hypothetical protein QZH41_014723 [Actinostola sp. cb2023]